MTTTPTPPIIPPDADPEEAASAGTSADADERAAKGQDPVDPNDAESEPTSADADREASMGQDTEKAP